jgi:hypothetical protein
MESRLEGALGMELTDLGEIIAERKFVLRNDSGTASEVLVLLGKPQQFPDSTDYYCPCQIKGVGSERIKYFAGVDAFQALDCTLHALGAELQHLNHEANGKISWDADQSGSLGFPIPD